MGRPCDLGGCMMRPPHATKVSGSVSSSSLTSGRRARHRHSSQRISVEYALADHKRWKQLTRWTHRRNVLSATYRAIASLVSDRTIPP